MTMHLKIKIKTTCPKHRKYDPEKSGEAGIKAGCVNCYRMLNVYNAAVKLREMARLWDLETE